MKKLLKLFLITITIMAFTLNLSVFAAENNATKTNNTASSNVTSTANNTTSENQSASTSSSTQVTSISSVEEDGLTMSNILNILLIATGVVIILLAIAIFIKLK